MKKILLFLLIAISCKIAGAEHFNITIITGPAYSPLITFAKVGDTVTISASSTHPVIQVNKAKWDAGITDTLAGGWGKKTADYTFKITKADTIFFMCKNHGPSGMKARIFVQPVLSLFTMQALPVLNIFSNPGHTIKFSCSAVQNSSVLTAKITDLNGKIMCVKLFKSTEIVEIENLQNGVYILNIITEKKEGNIFRKILIQ